MTDQARPAIDPSGDPLERWRNLLSGLGLLAFLGLVGSAVYKTVHLTPQREAREAAAIGSVDLRTDMTLAEFRQIFKGKAQLTTSTEVNACSLHYAGVVVTFYCGRRKEDVRDMDLPVRFYVTEPFAGTLHGVRLGDPRSSLDKMELGANWFFQFTTADDGQYKTSVNPNSRLSSISLYHSRYRFNR